MLARRLAVLVDEGVLERRPYQQPGARTRYEYRLTQAGRDLRPVLLALMEWGDRHRAGAEGPPAHVVHDSGWMDSVYLSLRVALAATALSLVIGTAAAYALVRGRLRFRGLVEPLLVLPMVVPIIGRSKCPAV